VWTVVYNLFLHPLRKFPGSKLFAASYLPTAITRIYGVATHTILKFHDMYGPIVRVGPNEISYIDARALKDIYGHRTGGKEAFQKDSRFYGLDASGAEGMFRAVDEDTHARQRRIFSHAFSEKALREQESIIKKYADKLTALLRQRAVLQHEAPIDILRMYNYTAFDIMGELAFSESLNLLEKDEYSPWVVAIFETFKFLAYTNVFKRYPPLDKVLLPSSVKNARAYHFANSVERCERRLASVSKKPDIWSFVVRAKEERKCARDGHKGTCLPRRLPQGTSPRGKCIQTPVL
jgi:cytochrome P450